MSDRLLRAVRALVRELVAPHEYHALVRYRVFGQTAGRVDLQIVNKSSVWPDVLPVSMRPGVPGASWDLTPGAVVLVSFVEGNPALPVVTHYSQRDDGAFLPLSAALDAKSLLELGKTAAAVKVADGALAAARMTDAVQAGPFSGAITAGSAKVMVG